MNHDAEMHVVISAMGGPQFDGFILIVSQGNHNDSSDLNDISLGERMVAS